MPRRVHSFDGTELDERLFAAMGNPMYAWSAYLHVRGFALRGLGREQLPPSPIPAWVLKYFDHFLINLDELARASQNVVSPTTSTRRRMLGRWTAGTSCSRRKRLEGRRNKIAPPTLSLL